MPRNQHFRFKQFTINQDKCAMKVCTDACILGAFVDVINADKILDIGAGTGLLSLMIAQRTNAPIEAVEIDEDAYNQAIENVANTPFTNQIKVYKTRIQEFTRDLFRSYSLIVSNPPFYQNSLQSPDNQTNKALHNTELSFEELADCVAKLLDVKGRFFVLLPYSETQKFVEIAKTYGLFVNHQLHIRHDENKPIFRVVSTFTSDSNSELMIDELKIWQENGKVYDQKFRELLKDYYLIF
ncbi:MAG: methyltransferase [Spirosomaceae bacterium]|jgi:tRNA1Val (adenine37-N6)-methyltransferase|nr:methyltransferase [Spirosomataceae bacterium]